MSVPGAGVLLALSGDDADILRALSQSGSGLCVVRRCADLPELLEAARRQALAARFGALTGHVHDQRVAVYTTLSLARLIAVSTRIPGREQWTGRLMDLCELRIKELHS